MPYKCLHLIGLTGNIACGKSTVLAMFQDRGAAVIDADQVTRQVQQPGEPVYHAIIEAFGETILVALDGPFNGQRLVVIVLSAPQALWRLAQIVHPAVHARILTRLDEVAAHAQIAVIDAVNLLEAGWKHVCGAIEMATCPRSSNYAVWSVIMRACSWTRPALFLTLSIAPKEKYG